MRIWAIADLHLSFGIPNKSMDYFGPNWVEHASKIEQHWRSAVASEDLVLIPGDICWAMKPEEAVASLNWIHSLPGTKVMIKGNHDYWWGSLSKVIKILPPSIHVIQNNAFHWKGISIGGTRLWDTSEYSFHPFIEFRENPRQRKKDVEEAIQEDLSDQIFERELQRLELSLKQLDPQAKTRIAMTHYPPIGHDLKPSKTSLLLEKYGIEVCVFGHLHNLKKGIELFGTARGVRYILTACDYTDFKLVQLL